MSFTPVTLFEIALLGLGVGYMSGLFGVGGGFMLTPLLIALFRVPEAIAVGSGLAQMIAVAASSMWKHAKAGYVDKRLAAFTAPGAVIGTLIGAWILNWLNQLGTVAIAGREFTVISLVINLLFAVLLLGIAMRMFFDKPGEDGTPACSGPLCWTEGPLPITLSSTGDSRYSLVSLAVSGLVIGVLAGLLGIGGGVVLIPLFMYGYSISLRVAIGTSSLLILVSAVIGTVAHAFAGHVDVRLVFALMAGSVLGANLGAWHSHRIRVTRLQNAFATLVMLVAFLVLYRLVTS